MDLPINKKQAKQNLFADAIQSIKIMQNLGHLKTDFVNSQSLKANLKFLYNTIEEGGKKTYE
jgi:hypothetical protein